jgi:hypothetical protein
MMRAMMGILNIKISSSGSVGISVATLANWVELCQRREQKRGEENKNSFHGLISKLLTGITASSL